MLSKDSDDSHSVYKHTHRYIQISVAINWTQMECYQMKFDDRILNKPLEVTSLFTLSNAYKEQTK